VVKRRGHAVAMRCGHIMLLRLCGVSEKYDVGCRAVRLVRGGFGHDDEQGGCAMAGVGFKVQEVYSKFKLQSTVTAGRRLCTLNPLYSMRQPNRRPQYLRVVSEPFAI
jgi:hypothetical protein